MGIEYDIHGILGLRIVGASLPSARFLAREMDPLTPSMLTSDPAVSLITSSETMPDGARQYLGNAGDFQECAFTSSDFWLRDGNEMLRIPFDSIGNSCELRHTPGFSLRRVLSYARPILQVSLLANNAVAVHSAAAVHEGKGILFAGWAESGKTEAMLAFLHMGSSFVSDKWTILSGDGNTMHNFPTPVTVRQWVLDRLPGLSENLTTAEQWRARAGSIAAALLVRARAKRGLKAVANFVGPAVNSSSRVSVPPSQLFGHSKSFPVPLSLSAPLRKIFFLVTGENREVSVRAAAPHDVAHRLVRCGEYERRGLLGLYTKFKYAIPDRASSVMDEVRERESAMLSRILESKEVFLVETAFPFDPMVVYAALKPFC